MDPRLDARDQIVLPGAALDLPDPQRREQDGAEQSQRQEPGFQEGPSMLVIGIMLVLRWYMIHSEPAITISTITAAKA